jgi:hypothetical protein
MSVGGDLSVDGIYGPRTTEEFKRATNEITEEDLQKLKESMKIGAMDNLIAQETIKLVESLNKKIEDLNSRLGGEEDSKIKGWVYRTKGEKTCDVCKSKDGKEYKNLYDMLDFPSHPNCDCILEPIYEDEENNENGGSKEESPKNNPEKENNEQEKPEPTPEEIEKAFEKAMEFIKKWEKEYSNHPNDPGGETFWGFAKKYHKDVDENTSMDEIENKYKKEYWEFNNVKKLPPEIAAVALDLASNPGTDGGAKVLQRALGLKDDGIIGSKTLEAAKKAKLEELLPKIMEERKKYYDEAIRKEPKKEEFRKGWYNRIDDMPKHFLNR